MDQSFWERLHPLAVLLPSGLLLAAIIVVFLGVVWAAQRRAFCAAAVAILAAGAIGAGVSVRTGRLSAHQLEQNIQQQETERLEELLAKHIRHTAAAAAMYYLAVVLCAALFLSPLVWKRLAQRGAPLLAELIILLWLAATGYALAHAADSGVRLARLKCASAAKADPWADAAAELAPPIDQRP